jgi:hydroxymethylglutaryl-CoA lyase
MLDGLGIAHGANLDAVVETSSWMAGKLGRPSASRVVNALAK